MYSTSTTTIINAWIACLLLLPMLSMAQFTNCSALLPHNTTTITSLYPNDIKIMMAMGDSITAGFGLQNAINESRGIAFSMGGDAGGVTLSNFIKFFSPSVLGYSVGTYPAEICYGTNCPALRSHNEDGNNAAKSGAMVFDMVSRQINYLTRQLNQNPFMDVQNDWKVLTIMIGANDLCASCTFDLPFLEADEYENNLMGTLERIRTSLPRTFVNLVPGFNISQAYDLSLKNPSCANVTRSLYISCDCLFKAGSGPIREMIDARMTLFNQRAAKVATYYQRKAYDNFAVVVQPFATNTHISDLPSKFLSPLDCFHPSKAGHEAMAIALWNSMLTPAANKKTTLSMTDKPICPTQNTLLYTY